MRAVAIMSAVLLITVISIQPPNIVLVSDPYTTTITSPQGATPNINKYYTMKHPNWQNTQAQWISIDATGQG